MAQLHDLLSTVAYPNLSPNLAMKIANRARLRDLFPCDWAKFAEATGLSEPYILLRGKLILPDLDARLDRRLTRLIGLACGN